MILLYSLIILLSLIIILHLIKYLTDRNKKKEEEGFKTFEPIVDNENSETDANQNAIVNKMKTNNNNTNKNNIKNNIKSQQEINREKHNKLISDELNEDIKEIITLNKDVKEFNESFTTKK